MDWTLFEFIESRPARLAVVKITQLMMHEECGAAQNYVVADAGAALICQPSTGPRGGCEFCLMCGRGDAIANAMAKG
jgi:hypothetical protein